MTRELEESGTRKRSRFQRWDGPLSRLVRLSTGSLAANKLPPRLQPEAVARTVCGYCSTGCSLDVHLRSGEAVNVVPTCSHPVNRGTACPKGWAALDPLHSADRATTPLRRNPRGDLEAVDWHTALRELCSRFKTIAADHGAESLAFLSTGQLVNEEMVYLGALAKLGMGMVHGDGNTRQCMATAQVAYKEAFGFDAPPYTYDDFENSDVIVLIGSNLCIAHPVLWGRLCHNPREPNVIVVDPRRTETAAAGTLHLALEPKSDLALLYGLAHLLIAEDDLDHEFIARHTRGFPSFAAHVQSYTPEAVAHQTRLPVTQLREVARLIGRGKRVSFWWTMGVNQSHEGVRVAQAIINLALMTGNIGRPGTGANSITGQCNAMGSRILSNTASLYGGRDFHDPTHRREVATALGVAEERIPSRPSLAYDQILESVDRGAIRGLWIVATNPAHSWIDQRRLRHLLDRLDFLVVQDAYTTTETAEHAHLFLPAAIWGEKEGTFINSERRLGLVRKVARAPGQALADFHIFRLVASYWGCASALPPWRTPAEVFASIRELTRGRPCDLSGVSGYDMIEARGGVQWPFPESDRRQGTTSSGRRLFEDGRFFHPDGRARFLYGDPTPLPEPADAAYPLLLITGRGSSAEWHTGTRTGKSATLRRLAPKEPYVEIHPADAEALAIRGGTWARIESRRGSADAKALLTPTVRPGQLFMPMHEAATNRVTLPAFDPYSRQPAYKATAVRLSPWSQSRAKGR